MQQNALSYDANSVNEGFTVSDTVTLMCTCIFFKRDSYFRKNLGISAYTSSPRFECIYFKFTRYILCIDLCILNVSCISLECTCLYNKNVRYSIYGQEVKLIGRGG